MSFNEFLQDTALALFLLLVLAWMTSCAYIEKNVYVLNSDNAEVTYTTKSETDTKADGKLDLKIPLVP